MKPELQKYYDHRFLMFASQGWKDFIADVQSMKNVANRLDDVTLKNLERRQGEVALMNWILGLEELTKKAMDEINADL